MSLWRIHTFKINKKLIASLASAISCRPHCIRRRQTQHVMILLWTALREHCKTIFNVDRQGHHSNQCSNFIYLFLICIRLWTKKKEFDVCNQIWISSFNFCIQNCIKFRFKVAKCLLWHQSALKLFISLFLCKRGQTRLINDLCRSHTHWFRYNYLINGKATFKQKM